MFRSVKKLSYRYNYLKLELEEIENLIEKYINEWNTTFGKYFVEDKVELCQNIETGELRDSPPNVEEKKKKRKTQPKKIKELYRKLSSKLHPDKGGTAEEFNELKKAYEEGDILQLVSLGAENNIETNIDEEDLILLENTISNLEKKISKQNKSMVFLYYTGDLVAKKAIIRQIEIMTGKKIDADSLLKG